MERFRKFLLLVACALVALSARTPVRAAGASVDIATLKKITSRLDARIGVLAIEASDPVPYVASQPDPKTFVVELRDVVAAPVTHPVQPDPRNPFAGVAVENVVAADGARVARVQLTLAAAVRPRVRSARNVIFVEADRLDTDAPAGGTVTASATTIDDILKESRAVAPAAPARAAAVKTPAATPVLQQAAVPPAAAPRAATPAPAAAQQAAAGQAPAQGAPQPRSGTRVIR